MEDLQKLLSQAQQAIHSAKTLKQLDDCRVEYLGKKGILTEYLKRLGQLPPQERPVVGQKINLLKEQIQNLLETQKGILTQESLNQALAAETIDVTLRGRETGLGSLHPITLTMLKLRRIFTSMGFTFMQGPEAETDYYNFVALNIPAFHPARAMQDTFYLENQLVLRTQMSSVQIHAMQKLAPPLRMVAMGRVYRRDFDITHTPMFHQLECLMIDEHVTFANLKGLLKDFLQAFFGQEVVMRFRPSYFPFTEPSAEVDIQCIKCSAQGCRICKFTGWLEILGCGMVHPNVLKKANIDANRFQGFAFGLGIDRLSLLKYNISDLRILFENDVRFLSQFSINA